MCAMSHYASRPSEKTPSAPSSAPASALVPKVPLPNVTFEPIDLESGSGAYRPSFSTSGVAESRRLGDVFRSVTPSFLRKEEDQARLCFVF